MLIDTILQMPGWAQFLTLAPLPMLITFSVFYLLSKENRNSYYSHEREIAWMVCMLLGIFYPFAWFLLAITLTLTLADSLEEQWYRFSKWAKSQHTAHQMSRKILPAKPPRPALIHLAKNGSTLCGVGDMQNVSTTNNSTNVTCDVCKDLM